MSVKLTLLSDSTVLLDGLPQGTLPEFLAAHPERLPDYLAAFRVRACEQHEIELDALRKNLASATAALDQMREEHAAALATERAATEQALAAAQAKAAALGAADTRIAQLERQVATLVGKYEAKPYYQVHALPAPFDPKLRPHWTEVTHVGVRRAPEIGGAWLVDLLHEMGTNEFARIVTGVEIPADPKVTSYTELKAESFTADLSTWHTAQNTKMEKSPA